MKKILAIALSLAMVLALAACGGTTSTAPSGSESAPAKGSEAAPEENKVYKIGMVTDVGGVNDQSFNQTSWEGLQALAAEDPSFEVKYLESATDADYSVNIETFLDEEYDLIICVGYMLAEATREAALANPEQKFAIIDDSTNADLPNVACLMFDQNVASYLVGIVAGMATESNVVGYVQGMVSESMNQFAVGFISGVLDTNPEATVLQYNANSFGDSALGNTAAVNMITNGADVIYHAAGGTGGGVIEACKDAGIYAIGVDTDQSPIAPEYVITSAMKRVDTAAQDISKSVKEGTFTAGVHTYGMANNGVGLAPTQTLLTEEMLAAVKAAEEKIAAGEIVVPATKDELEAVHPGVFTLE